MNIEKKQQILVRRRAALGDVIMSTGVIRELKNRFDCEIDVATEFVQVYNNNPHIRKVYHTEGMPSPDKYDLYINLDDAYEYNPTNHYLDSYFYRAFGTSNVDNKAPEIYATDEEKKLVEGFQLGKFIAVHMRYWHWPVKNMELDTWFEVYEKLFSIRDDFKVVVLGTSQDHYIEHPLFIDARDKLTIQQQKIILDAADCFVGTDSGPYHIAAASSTPIVSLHTHLLPERIAPTWKNVIPITSNIDCVGCNDIQERPVRQIVCKYNDYRCNKHFDSTAIANAILSLIK